MVAALGPCHTKSTNQHPKRGRRTGGGVVWRSGSHQDMVTSWWPQQRRRGWGSWCWPHGHSYPEKGGNSWAWGGLQGSSLRHQHTTNISCWRMLAGYFWMFWLLTNVDCLLMNVGWLLTNTSWLQSNVGWLLKPIFPPKTPFSFLLAYLHLFYLFRGIVQWKLIGVKNVSAKRSSFHNKPLIFYF